MAQIQKKKRLLDIKVEKLEERYLSPNEIGFWLLRDLLIKEKKGTQESSDVNTRKTIQLIKAIGNKCINEYQQSMCDLFVSELQLKYDPSTFNDYRTILVDSFGRARNDNVITKSPFDNVKSLRCPIKPKKVFNQKQIALLSPACTDMTIEKAIVTLALCTGLRINELIAITVNSYHRESKILYIEQSLVSSIIKSTKTDDSTRAVELSEYAIRALEFLIRLTKDHEEISYDLYIGDKVHEKRKSIFIVLNPYTGKRFRSADNFRKAFFRPYCNEVGVEYIAPKNLRHTYISQMLTAGAPITWIIKQVGHTDYDMIEKHYGKWIHEDSRKAQELIASHFEYLFEPNEKRSIWDRIKTFLGFSAK